eukprot:SM000169S02731  [mRNA]  locus=s169:222869:230303:- [translate_table: standard]
MREAVAASGAGGGGGADEAAAWSAVDAAESLRRFCVRARGLLCGDFEGAASSARRALESLLSAPASDAARDDGESVDKSGDDDGGNDGDDGDVDEEAAAGAVLVQALDKLWRHQELLDTMTTLYMAAGGLLYVPHSVLVMWVSLQVAAREVMLARKTLEAALAARRSTRRYGPVQLVLARLYAVDVLTVGCSDPSTALAWLEADTNLPIEQREALVKTVQRLAKGEAPADIQTSAPSPRLAEAPSGAEPGKVLLEGQQTSQKPESSGARASTSTAAISQEADNRNDAIDVKLASGTGRDAIDGKLASRTGRETHKRLQHLVQRKLLGSVLFERMHVVYGSMLGVVVAVLILYSAARERAYLSRLAMRLLRAFRQGLADTLQLAFSGEQTSRKSKGRISRAANEGACTMPAELHAKTPLSAPRAPAGVKRLRSPCLLAINLFRNPGEIASGCHRRRPQTGPRSPAVANASPPSRPPPRRVAPLSTHGTCEVKEAIRACGCYKSQLRSIEGAVDVEQTRSVRMVDA